MVDIAVGPPYVKVSNSQLCSGPSCVKVSNSRLCLGPPASNSPQKGRHFCQYFSTDGACQNLDLWSGPFVSNSQKKMSPPVRRRPIRGPCCQILPPYGTCVKMSNFGRPRGPYYPALHATLVHAIAPCMPWFHAFVHKLCSFCTIHAQSMQ